MTNKILKTVTAGVFLAATALSPVAFAQQATTPAQPSMQTPADTTGNTTAPSASTDSAEVGSTYLTEQAQDQVSANTYIGQSVYNSADEKVGDISDLVMKKDGGLVAAVIGVGGFLGIGQKNVAVPMQNVTVTQNPDGGNMKLTTSETAETLKAAPEFKTLSMQQAEAQPVSPGTDSTTTSSTTTQPAQSQAPAN